MRENIKRYLLEELKLDKEVVIKYVKKYSEFPGVAEEFSYWIEKREFSNNPGEVRGCSAELLHTELDLTPFEAYNCLIFMLQENKKATPEQLFFDSHYRGLPKKEDIKSIID